MASVYEAQDHQNYCECGTRIARELGDRRGAAGGEDLSADIDHAFVSSKEEGVGGLLQFVGLGRYRTRMIDLAARNRLPAVYTRGQWVAAGGLMSYGSSWPDLHRRAAIYVDKILRGANPAELPVEQPQKFELIINLKTEKQLGITIPSSILYRADKVIK